MTSETTDTATIVAEDEPNEQHVQAPKPAHDEPKRTRNGNRSPRSRHYRVASSGQVVVEPEALRDSAAVQEMVRLARELVQKTRAREAQ